MKKIFERFDRFFFAPVDLRRLAVVRIVLGLMIFWLAVDRQGSADLFFGENGLVQKDQALNLMLFSQRPAVELFFWTDSLASVFHWVYVVLSFCFVIGFGNRVLWVSLWILHMGFVFRNYSVIFGADLISGLFLFYLMWTRSHARWSVNALVFRKKNLKLQKSFESSDLLSPVFSRLLQIQLMVIYFYTGIEKLKGSSWWDGTALWTVFANPQMTLIDLSWTASFWPFLVMMTFVTIVFEIFWPILVWFKGWNLPILIFGFFFHFGIGLLMWLFPFSFVMLSVYVLFLREDIWQGILSVFARGRFVSK